MDRKSSACQNLVEKPKPRHDIAAPQTPSVHHCRRLHAKGKPGELDILVPHSPISKTDFRPKRGESATRPHSIAVTNWAAVKLALRRPAWPAMVESGSAGFIHLSW